MFHRKIVLQKRQKNTICVSLRFKKLNTEKDAMQSFALLLVMLMVLFYLWTVDQSHQNN